MKFIHCADLHIDSKIEGLPSTKSSNRKEEVLHSFERLCVYAKDNDIKAVIISGDMFDGKTPTKRSLDRVIYAISNAKGVDFLYLNGNHDDNAFSFEGVCNVPKNLKIFNHGFSSFRYDNVVIGAINVSNEFPKNVYDLITFEKDSFNILAMHGQVADYKTTQASSLISIPQLKEKYIDYLALGHYHTFSSGKIDERGIYAYSGCLDGRGFDELGEKGFVLIDTESKDYYKFVKFSSREYHEFNFDLSFFDDWFTAREQLLKQVNGSFSSNDILKIILLGERTTDFYVDLQELTDRLNDNFFFAKVYDKTTLKICEEDYLADKTVRGEFVRLVWESDLTPEQKKKIITCGLNAIKGEDIL